LSQDSTARTFREVLVEPADSKREILYVAGFLVILLLLATARIAFLQKAGNQISLQPYQRLDTTLNDAERTMYQALLSSQQEIVRLWEKSGIWPTVEQLDEEGIPPFATDLMPGKLSGYTWVMHDRGPWVDYIAVGPEEDKTMPSVLLRIINLHADFHPHPHPGKDYDPGQKAAVQIWINPESLQKYPGMMLAEHGWAWILSPDDPILKPQKS